MFSICVGNICVGNLMCCRTQERAGGVIPFSVLPHELVSAEREPLNSKHTRVTFKRGCASYRAAITRGVRVTNS